MDNLFADSSYILNESRLFRQPLALKLKDVDDIKNILILYIFCLDILKNDFDNAEWVQDYLVKTFKYGYRITKPKTHDTDLHHALYILSEKDFSGLKQSKNNDLAARNVNIPVDSIIRWAKLVIMGKATPQTSQRMYTALFQGLHMNQGDYRNLAVLISQWNRINHAQQKIACTRLKQMLREHARLSEIYPVFTKYVEKNNMILPAEKNEKTTSNTSTFLVGLGLGYIVARMSQGNDRVETFRQQLKQKLEETTTSANIASVTTPLGSTITRYGHVPKFGTRRKKTIFT